MPPAFPDALHLTVLTGTDAPSVDSLIAAISSEDPETRTEAWLAAGEVGAPAVGPLAALANHEDLEVVRAAKRGLWRIVRHAGRPGADKERNAVADGLVKLLENKPSTALVHEVLWMLSEIGGDEAAGSIAPFLKRTDSREDARMALERTPGEKSLALLKAGLEEAPDDYKAPIAQSLRNRGVSISKYPSAKLVPTESTEVKPLEEAAQSGGKE